MQQGVISFLILSINDIAPHVMQNFTPVSNRAEMMRYVNMFSQSLL
jgi:hypothetical protein